MNHMIMTSCTALTCSPDSPLQVGELIELICINLDGRDLIRMSLVCRRWKDWIALFRLMPRFGFKFPTPCIERENPHFDEPSAAYKSLESAWNNLEIVTLNKSRAELVEEDFAGQIVVLQEENGTPSSRTAINLPNALGVSRGAFAGDPVLEAMRKVDLALETIHDGDDRSFDTSSSEMQLYDIRGSFRGVRFPNGWPVGLRDVRCELCDRFHTAFRFQNLHPILRFLEDTTICFRGQGSRLRVHLDIISEQLAPRTCYKHYYTEILELAENLRAATRAIETGGLGYEFCAHPVITKMLTTDGRNEYTVIEDDRGLTLNKIVPFLISHFYHNITWEWMMIHGNLANGLPPLPTGEWHLQAAFPGNSYNDHKRDFPELVKMFERTISAVDGIMANVESWKPIVPGVSKENGENGFGQFQIIYW